MIKGHDRLTELAAVPFVKGFLLVLFVVGFAFWFVSIRRLVRSIWRSEAEKKRKLEREVRAREDKVQAEQLMRVVVGVRASEQWKDFPAHVVAHGMVSAACVRLRLAGYSDEEIGKLLASGFTASGRVVDDYHLEAMARAKKSAKPTLPTPPTPLGKPKNRNGLTAKDSSL